MVAPLNIARGTQNKILEAMAMGVPVVTSRVAAGGVDAGAGRAFACRPTRPREICAAILRVLDDPAERARLARAGRERDAVASRLAELDAAAGRHHRALPRRPSRPSPRSSNQQVTHEHQHLRPGLRRRGVAAPACRDGHQVIGVDIDRQAPA